MSNLFEDAEALGDAQLITQMRILDTLYTILMLKSEKHFTKLVDLHEKGGYLNPDILFDPEAFNNVSS